MTAAILLLNLLMQPPMHAVHVDLCVINYHRSVNESEPDAWGRTTNEPSMMVWLNYFDRFPATVIPTEGLVVNRGWDSISELKSIVNCSDGWLIHVGEKYVIAGEIRTVCSPFDWEMRNRWCYQPIGR